MLRTVASRSEGIEELMAAVERHRDYLQSSGSLAARRRGQLRLRVETLLKERVLRAARQEASLEETVRNGFAAGEDPYTLADRLFSEVVRAESAGLAGEGTGVPGRGEIGGVMIQRIDHVGIAVHSIAEARGFYESLGLTVAEIEEVPQEGVRVAMIDCGESRIELLEPTRPDSPIARHLEKRGPGLHHLCLASSDVRADDAVLRDAGSTLLRPEPTPGRRRVLGAVRPPQERRGRPARAVRGAGARSRGRAGPLIRGCSDASRRRLADRRAPGPSHREALGAARRARHRRRDACAR